MSPEPTQASELSHTCTHPGCCSHEAIETETTPGPAAGTSPGHLATKGAVMSGSLKSYLLWFLAFFGIYASSSVCVF